jgi:threonine aldolase
MSQEKIGLASDNYAPAHPRILEALSEANKGWASPYGLDPWTLHFQKLMEDVFGPCRALLVPTGTGANVLGLTLACKRYESVLCSAIAHLLHQEAGAAEAAGIKLLSVPHRAGKIIPEEIFKRLELEKSVGHHATMPRLLSITQSTEVGTVYSLNELKALAKLCKQENLFLHMDGSRLYNAAVALKTSLRALTQDLDLLSLGGTKNGLMGAEALLIFNPALQQGCDYLQKQTLQLPSKMRYFAAQYIAFFEDDLWRTLAEQANERARELANFLEEIPEVAINFPVETNQIFFSVPSHWITQIQKSIECYLWDASKHELRFVTSWSTTPKDLTTARTTFKNLL